MVVAEKKCGLSVSTFWLSTYYQAWEPGVDTRRFLLASDSSDLLGGKLRKPLENVKIFEVFEQFSRI